MDLKAGEKKGPWGLKPLPSSTAVVQGLSAFPLQTPIFGVYNSAVLNSFKLKPAVEIVSPDVYFETKSSANQLFCFTLQNIKIFLIVSDALLAMPPRYGRFYVQRPFDFSVSQEKLLKWWISVFERSCWACTRAFCFETSVFLCRKSSYLLLYSSFASCLWLPSLGYILWPVQIPPDRNWANRLPNQARIVLCKKKKKWLFSTCKNWFGFILWLPLTSCTFLSFS